jgi:hypothetical protein
MKPSLVVLAAGLGSRYGSLKQIDQFGPSGETIIDYSIYDAIRAGFNKVVFIIRRNIEKEFKEVFLGKFGDMVEVDHVFQEIDIVPEGVKVPEERQKPWGTGHAVMMASEVVNEPFAVINADDFYGAKSIKLLHDHLATMDVFELDACLIGYKLKNTLSDHGHVSRGVCAISEDGFLESITERTHVYNRPEAGIFYNEDDKEFLLSGEELASMNLFGLTPPFFKVLKDGFRQFVERNLNNPQAEFFLPHAVSSIIGNQKIRIPVIETPDMTYGVTYKDDKPIVKNMIRNFVEAGLYPENLWK